MVVPPSWCPDVAASVIVRLHTAEKLRYFFTGSIRRLLTALVAIAILPALGIILLTGFEARQHALSESERNALLLAQGIGEIQQRTNRGIHQLLEQLADMPQIRAGDFGAATEHFKTIAAAFPAVSNIAVVAPDGRVLSAALPVGDVNLGDRPYVAEALRRGAFTAGAYQLGRMQASMAASPSFLPASRLKNNRPNCKATQVFWAVSGMPYLAVTDGTLSMNGKETD